MKELWSSFTAWLSGWPGGRDSTNKKSETKQKAKPKKIKGLNAQKKKARKQGNMK